MKLELTADRNVTVDGLGILNPDEPRQFSAEEVAAYCRMHGLPVTMEDVVGSLPEGVEATVIAGGDV